MAEIRVLHVLSGIGYQGGVQALIWNYYKYFDTNSIHFDFLVHSNRMEGFEKRFTDKGSKIFYVPPKREGILQNYRGILKVMQEQSYDIVHVHQDFLGYIALYAAKKAGIKVRIMHSHKANMKESNFKHILRLALTKISVYYATDLFACGEDAAKWTYGEKTYKSGEVYVLKNAIESTQFLFDKEKRNSIRAALSLEGKVVVGNVARFTYQKNHELLIDVAEYMKSIDPRVIFMLIGSGELLEDMKKRVTDKELSSQVLFLGERNDVTDLLQAMDVFLLTSRFEGLPVTMVEAQAADLPCVVSDNITHEININNQTTYVKLEDSLKCWAEAILHADITTREDMREAVRINHYDIQTEADRLAEYYCGKMN